MIEALINFCQGNTEIETFVRNQVAARLKKKPETSQEEVEHIIDYLRISEEAPKRLIKASYKDMNRKAEEWSKRQQKKGQGIIETEEDTHTEIDFGDGFKLVKLVSKNSYQREGTLMGACQGNYYKQTSVSLYSVRDSLNNPHCTFEVKKFNKYINQIKGKGNGCIHPKYIHYVIKSLEHFNGEVNTSQLKYMGYNLLDEETLKVLDENFTYKWISFQGKKFVYTHLTPKRNKGVSQEDILNLILES